MGDSQYFDTLVTCYLSKELSAEDEKWFLELVNSDEEKRRRFEEMSKVFSLTSIEESIEEINVDSEWERIGQRLFLRTETAETSKEDSGDGDETEISGSGSWKRWVTVAASIAVLVFLGMRWVRNVDPGGMTNEVAVKNDLPSSLEYQINTTDVVKHFELPDGSQVDLHPKSWINYEKEMSGNVRMVKLLGKAVFQVAKIPQRPFTVYSGDITTTAIGTRFVVSAFEFENNITVRLEEGKVVVRPEIESKGQQKEYFLLPGQEFIYNRVLAKGTVRKYTTKDKPGKTKVEKKESTTIENVTIPFIDKTSNWFMFNNQALPEVFDQLKEMYQVDIVYQKRQIANLYFIGAFRTTDSIEAVLNKIAELNGLRVTQEGGKYYLKKIR